MIDITRKTYERTCIETIVDNDRIVWLNEKHNEEGLDHKYLRATTLKYLSNHRKRRYELSNKPR